MFINIIKSYRDVVAICDSDLIGKNFEEGEFQLDVKESFFKGKDLPKEEIERMIRTMKIEDATFNIVGKESVELALNTGAISQEGVKEISGIPFALVLL